MAKRVSLDDKPFNPVQEALTRSVLMPSAEPISSSPPSPAPPGQKVVSTETGRQVTPTAPTTALEAPKKLAKVRRFLLTDEEDYTLNQLATEMGRRLGTPINISHLLRATTTLLMNSSEELLKQGDKMSGLKRPANNDAAALVAFEHTLTKLVERAIRNSKIME